MTVQYENGTYLTVAERLREALPGIEGIQTTISNIAGMWISHTVLTMTDGRSFTGNAEVTRGYGTGPQATSPVECAETSSVGRALAFAGFFGSATGIAGIEELRISESRADTIRIQARNQEAQDRLDGIGVHAPTSPQPEPSVPPQQDDEDWHLGRPSDADGYTDQPARSGFRRN